MADGLLNKASIILTPTGYKAGTLYNVAPVVEPYEDFDFARASVASRVNSSGLVEMVGRTLSSELVADGDFPNLDNWSVNGGDYATIVDGALNSNNTENGNWHSEYISQNISFVNGKTYKVTFKAKNISGDPNLRLTQNGYVIFTQNITSSFVDYEVYYTASADNGSIRIFCNSAVGEFQIDNVSVKEIIDTNNIPRISYDSNGENGHILLEPTSTNLIPYSEDFSQSAWTKTRCTIDSGGHTSPSGESNAFKMTATDDDARLQDGSEATGVVYTQSIYVKSATGSNVSGQIDFTGTQIQTFTATSEWQRVDTTSDDTRVGVVRVRITNSGDKLYIWGAQLEALSYASSYIPTLTGSTETRATETATGAGSATLINSTEGVLYAEIAALSNDGTSRRISLSNGSISNRVSLEIDETANRIRVHINASLITYDASDLTSFNKIAVKYKVNDYALWLNGVEVATSSSSEQPSGMNVLSFTNPTEAQVFYGKVKALAVFNEALSDDELNNLTG